MRAIKITTYGIQFDWYERRNYSAKRRESFAETVENQLVVNAFKKKEVIVICKIWNLMNEKNFLKIL